MIHINKVLEIMNILNNIEYGFKDKDGNNLINSEIWDKDFYNFYYLLSPEELLNSKCGVCWDQVELERKLFNEANIDCDTYFIYIDDNESLPSHTFLTFQLNDKYYWFEHSWNDMKGIHEYNNFEKLLNDVKTKFIDSRKNEINPNLNYYIYIYKYNQPKYHIKCDEFYDYIKTQKKIDI